MKREQKKPFVGMLACAAVGLLAPTAGLLITSLKVSQAFGEVANVAPSMKANVLARGINDSMDWTVGGIAVGFLGLVASLICAVMFVRSGKEPTVAQSAPSSTPQ